MRRSDYDSVTPVITESNNVHGTFQELYLLQIQIVFANFFRQAGSPLERHA